MIEIRRAATTIHFTAFLCFFSNLSVKAMTLFVISSLVFGERRAKVKIAVKMMNEPKNSNGDMLLFISKSTKLRKNKLYVYELMKPKKLIKKSLLILVKNL